jgi:hypothetical protein
MNVKQRYREIQVRLYQRIADFIIKMLETVSNAKDDYLFGIWLDMGMKFDAYCVDKDIFLD